MGSQSQSSNFPLVSIGKDSHKRVTPGSHFQYISDLSAHQPTMTAGRASQGCVVASGGRKCDLVGQHVLLVGQRCRCERCRGASPLGLNIYIFCGVHATEVPPHMAHQHGSVCSHCSLAPRQPLWAEPASERPSRGAKTFPKQIRQCISAYIS